ncbi:hypothetical protein PC117_g4771 [Phytophthora cactorum]|uniref:Transmembrane protein 231 n=2 Tax=Phytophthora cactorum TaxID=29920 RepID=A0A8T1E6L4_9STRA|nr:hypothetical protein PC117_g4771 [Phytophthora cactorum]
MRATCHRSSMQRRYCSGVLSLSHVVSMVLWVVAVALPLLLALGSRDFVLQVDSYREQPVVGFKDEVLCILEGEQEGGRPLTLVHSTFPERVQQLYSNESLQAAFVKTSSTDVNEDGIAESVRVEIATPLSTNEIIRQATVVVVLDYTLKSYAKLNMDVLTVFRHSSLFAGDTLYVDGDLDLHQRSALEITDSMQQPYIDSPIVNMTSANTTQELLVQSLISGYRERNYTANFHAPYPIWTPNSNSSEDIRVFRVLMDIRIDTANVLYTPEWPEMVKHAWIQYYCIFMVVSTLAFALREYLFTNKLLPSVCVVDEPRLKFAKYE